MGWLSTRFELGRGAAGENLRSMEGLRGVAVILVFFVHFVGLADPWLAKDALIRPAAQALATVGHAGVDLFFLLSGYLIYGSLLRRPQVYGPYLRRRLVRIYPTFLAVFLLYLVLSVVFPSESKLPASAGEATLLVFQNLLLMPGIFPVTPVITVAWSLSYELFYYILIPAVLVVTGMRQWDGLERVRFWLGVTAASGVMFAILGGPVRLIMFVAGILLFEAMARPRSWIPSGAAGMVALVVGPAALLLPVRGSAGYTLQVGILFVSFWVLGYSCFARPTDWLARGLSWAPLRWLGNMSYSYYLLHGVTLKGAFLALSLAIPVEPRGSLFLIGLLAPMAALTIVTSAALFLLIERPLSLMGPANRAAALPGTVAGAGV